MLKRKCIAYKSQVTGKYYAYGNNQDLPELGPNIVYYGPWGTGPKGQILDLPKDEYPYTVLWSDDITVEELRKHLGL